MALYVSNQATVSSTAQSLADLGFGEFQIGAASEVVIAVTDAAIRYTFSETATASNGHLIGNGDTFVFSNESFSQFSCIRQAGTDAELYITLRIAGNPLSISEFSSEFTQEFA